MTDPTPSPDDDRIEDLDPEAMLALIRDQQRSVEGQRGGFVPLILLAWGIAWLVGFLALWLIDGAEGFSLPVPVAAPVFAGLLIAAGILSTILGIRADRGLRGGKEGAIVGMVYGNTWWIGSIAFVFIGQALVFNGMSTDLLGILYPSGFIFFGGIMYIMAGLLWRAYPMLALGLWSILVSAAGPFLGQPAHYLFFALAGGGGFLLMALWTLFWTRSARRRVAKGARS